MTERRRCQRIQHTKSLRARVHSGEPARVLDLSPYGALVESTVALRPGSECDVALALGSSGLHLRSAIRRCRAEPDTDGDGIVYRAGLEFAATSGRHQDRLEDFVAKLCLLDEREDEGGVAA